MKNHQAIIPLLLFISSCSDETEHAASTNLENNQETEIINSLEAENEVELIQDSDDLNYDLPEHYSSAIRPGENLELGKIYLDTVNYVSFNDDADYWIIIAEKNQDTMSIICQDFYDFPPGEPLIIEWEIDSFRHAGDPEFLNFSEFLISVK